DLGVLTTLARQMAAVIERARLADMEREALEKLREADRLKDDFIATVSHELRTPLTSIKGYAETMRHRKTALSEHDRSSFLDVIIRQCDRLATIVDALLLVSRVEAGEIGGKPTFVKVDELVRGAVEDAGDGRRIDVRLSIADPNAGIVADHFRLHHGLRNLIENACKYSPPGAPVLVTGRVEEEELVVEVLDRGPGIPPGAEETIFERFSRLADPGRSEVPGTGLGLYIARRFARDLGGDIVVGRSGRADFSGAHLILTVPTVLAPVRSHPA
ncbi:MAG TPA: ATP-binding protein, partial [Actinomycetota bacterium]|nr:ATP-binding protein [Actinomycetota bacterium]